MKLIYISPLRYPSEKAGSLFSMKSCEVFANEGIETELWIPRRLNVLSDQDPYEYSGVNKNFKIRRFLTIDLIGYIPGAFYLMSYTFTLSILVYVLSLKIFRNINSYYFYSHEQIVIYALTFISKKTAYEMHDFPSKNSSYKIFFKRIEKVISTNRWKSEELQKRFAIKKDKIITVPNAVDLKDFSADISIEVARRTLSIPFGDILIGYVGALKTMGMEKGISVLIDSLVLLPKNYKLYIIGGSKDDVKFYEEYSHSKKIERQIIFAGNVLHKDIGIHMKACNCLVAPYPRTDHYSYYMSPMKVFEYMASGRPMIVTDLPSIREIVDETNALFVPSDDIKSLAITIEKIVNNKELAYTLTTNAIKDAKEKYSWHGRARIIMSKII